LPSLSADRDILTETWAELALTSQALPVLLAELNSGALPFATSTGDGGGNGDGGGCGGATGGITGSSAVAEGREDRKGIPKVCIKSSVIFSTLFNSRVRRLE
jgi:hypothetical protein